ncbi:hypothetical protein [Sphingobium sp.]|uniref:hypothetical protein n=1 Tax=Sphingobium sp. TaxID=1912891 RepID=UPI00261F8A40|nr:hypothetical protein [Sphingobium sp.]
MIRISLFVRDPFKGRNAKGEARLRFNPYVRIAGFELCMDRDGIAIHTPRRSFGFIRGAGFWKAAA